jgi:uncharacterized membrane protein YkoI
MTRTARRRRRHALTVLAVTLGLLGAPQLVLSAAVSMEQAVKMTENRYHARVVKAQTQKDGGRTVYVLRLLNDSGHVWTVRVDAATGAVL